MNIIKKIRIETKDRPTKWLFVFGRALVSYYRDSANKKHYSFHFFNKNHSVGQDCVAQDMIYLKVHRDTHWTIRCLQHWVNIVESMKGDFIIICDNDKLEKKIYKNIIFPNGNVKMIKSTTKPFKNISKYLAKNWQPAGNAHLTTFYHSKKVGIKNFWNIDADDTMICLEPQRAAEMLNKASFFAQQAGLSAFSLDMHTSRMKGRYWSFGVSFIQHNIDWFDIMHTYIATDSQHVELPFGSTLNLDFFLSHLKKCYGIKIGSFYAENLFFLHCPTPSRDFITIPFISSIIHYKEAQFCRPILKLLYNSPLSEIPIDDSIIKIDEIEGDGIVFFNNHLQEDTFIDFREREIWGKDTNQARYQPFHSFKISRFLS